MAFTTIYNDPYNRANITEPWVSWDNAFTSEELEKIVIYCEQFEMGHGVLAGTENLSSEESKKIAEKYRVSNTKFHFRNPDTAWIFDRLNTVIQIMNEQFYGFDLNGYEKFQYTLYDGKENGRYDYHIDTTLGIIGSNEMTRKLSLTMCLNDTFKGGEFHISVGSEDNPLVVPAQKGRIILFPSFVSHRVTPVTSGIRRSLVVWIMGPKFR